MGEHQSGIAFALSTPCFTPERPLALEPWQLLRECIPLPEPQEDDNYEISDGGNSDADEADEAKRRAKKHVPKWCENYLDALREQSDLDPDTIFGSRIPKCPLEVVF